MKIRPLIFALALISAAVAPAQDASILLPFVTATGSSAYPIPTDDLAFWFRPGATLSADSVYGNYPGTVRGFSITTNGFTGSSLTNSVVTSPLYRPVEKSISICFWIKRDSAANHYVFTAQGASATEFGPAVFVPANGVIQFFHQFQPYPNYIGQSTGSGLVPTGVWRHVICEREAGGLITDASKYRIFVNCVSQTVNSMSYGTVTNWGSSTSAIGIGNYPALSYGVQGSLDEVIVYDRLLTAAEKTNIFTQTRGTK